MRDAPPGWSGVDHRDDPRVGRLHMRDGARVPWFKDAVAEPEEDQSGIINSLTTRIGEHGYLSTYVWNLRSRYLTFPDASFDGSEVRTLVEAFLAELAHRVDLEKADG